MMDNPRAFDEGAVFESEYEDEPRMDAPPEIGFDERRMHVRAYNYWVSLLDGRAYPSIEDLDPATLDDFGPHSVLLDFTKGSANPGIAFVGRALREQSDLDAGTDNLNAVPSRSLLSRLTDHYLQIIANCAPIGFEAEFVSYKGLNTMYRGILMPLSSDGETIDFIYGVINWKELADRATTTLISRQVDSTAPAPTAPVTSPVWADGPNAMPESGEMHYAPKSFADDDDTLELGVQYRQDEADGDWLPGLDVDPEAGLADRLAAARESADEVKSADGRSRSALYRALGHAFDFALAADADPDAYAEMLEDAGLKAQDRAPMTPIVKLIFGADYDKTRLTEFAAALSFGRRQELGPGMLPAFLERFEGGLKGVVGAERLARRPDRSPDRAAAQRSALRDAAALATIRIDLPSPDDEFVLLVARRESDGRLAIVAPVRADANMLDKAIRKTA